MQGKQKSVGLIEQMDDYNLVKLAENLNLMKVAGRMPDGTLQATMYEHVTAEIQRREKVSKQINKEVQG